MPVRLLVLLGVLLGVRDFVGVFVGVPVLDRVRLALRVAVGV